MLIQIVGAFIAIVAFSVVIETPKKFLGYCGLTGAAGWAVYLICNAHFGPIWANFISALVISLVSHLFARVLKTPVTIFLISGILTLVPGAAMYHAGYELFMGNMEAAASYLALTAQIAGVIALAIFIMDSVFQTLKKINKPEHPDKL